jgi:hypothetical protein
VYLPFRTAEYRIVSVTGSTVASGKLQRASSSIDVAAVPEGTYILQLQAPNGVRAYTPFIKAPN